MRSVKLREAFPTWFLLALLAVSVATNVVFVARERGWHLPSFKADIPPVGSLDHVRGDPRARVTIVVYTDFQCPYCAAFHQSLLQVSKRHEVRWVYRHYPLAALHPLALQTAEAAECAADEGRFWEYADAVFARQQALSTDELSRIAGEVGIEPRRLATCLASGRHRDRVLKDAQAVRSGRVTGTPTFYVNGERHEGALPAAQLERLVR